ncbi:MULTISPECIES: dihydroxyacetone kinase subunit DhaL [Enterobacteriaceae]|uniref:dihydroxyacetone kinase subunit DhaL n=1 Tax=Enterobacteriaceae TaxID=543 RepID=UPI0015DC7F1A|nr:MULTISPECIES: dihydroxyacetone kinase subunit DhaL [unclassified Klebsiella]HAT3954844.1 dihydroxyacetone kinase subunit L [Kluyvera ascorbata]BBR61120.1 dihydroxyacetone kinase subunit L [Klebsiella sp. WP4-W18-ESBL-05]BBS93810.1 dihydroxyacetone kinase subunit L [Klebsiella sp. WP7-S18-CRE-02]BBS98839.1 dihydroxyacetone kinase subunit L [Klebsiella sp. WP7-S18-CRE-03]BBT03906.1 dihydroxyacetone kinase subunit L [Klebsiella sp. WP7-S18-ESBL-04]
MNVTQFTACLRYVCEGMIASEPRLTALDQVIGDGDHGIGIKRGFTALHALLTSADFAPADIGDCLLHSGTRLMTSMGGASGAIFGTLFRTGGKGMMGQTDFDAAALAEWLAIGMQAIHQRGGAKPGDKTMVDALAAASERANADVALPLSESLSHCAQAAMVGSEKTAAMVARFGRAKNLGERAIGHCDPGAVSMALILRFMAEFAQRG